MHEITREEDGYEWERLRDETTDGCTDLRGTKTDDYFISRICFHESENNKKIHVSATVYRNKHDPEAEYTLDDEVYSVRRVFYFNGCENKDSTKDQNSLICKGKAAAYVSDIKKTIEERYFIGKQQKLETMVQQLELPLFD